ncbi:MAG: energy-coupling factor ABC transporter permease [Dechloromonas sp.]|nr:energy-coupling factor ABC transporter permease [Dechloromonas sp.]
MNLTDTLLGETWYWAAWLIWLPFFARSLWRAPWRRLRDSEQLNVWLGMVVLLTLVWSLKAGVKPGLAMHLLGVNLFVLAFGPHLAFIGLSLVTLGITLNGAAGPLAYALNALLLGGVGVVASDRMGQWVMRLLPRHFFIFIFINGFLVSALSILAVGGVSCFFLAWSGAYAWDYLFAEYFPYFLLLAFSEAWLSGMLVTLFVIYRPQWMGSFDDARYLSGK